MGSPKHLWSRQYDFRTMTQPEDDPWQLRPALQGDESAWARIVEEFATTIWHWARSSGLSREDAEDVAQVVWYKLKDRGHTIRDPSRLAGWLARTTKNEAAVARRRARREFGQDFAGSDGGDRFLADARPSPEDLALIGETRQQLALAYVQLTETCRELLALCWSGMPVAQIAAAIGRTPGYVGPTRMRCLQSLREIANIDG